MTQQAETEVYYPESDGQPVGETAVHRQLLMDLVFAFSRFFAGRPDVYVTGNLFVYYVKGDPRRVVCPDVCVVFGAAKRRRNTYQTWRDGPFPQVVIELTSSSTRAEDEGSKRELYERLGVIEYYLFDPHFDPEGPAEPSGVGDLKRYQRPAPGTPFGSVETVALGAVLHSDTLGLGFTVRGRDLRLVDEATGLLLRTPDEDADALESAQAAVRAELAAREAAEAQAQAEAAARQAAEERARELADEVARLRAQLDQRPGE